MTKKIAIVIAGCGNKDGTEITEAVSLIIALSSLGAQLKFFAPNKEFTAKNFLTNHSLLEKRNLMCEAARITRSEISPLEQLYANDFDALALPGGYGAAVHLSTWANDGAKCSVDPVLSKIILDFHSQSKPIAAICIAPVILAKLLGPYHVCLTLGEAGDIINEVEKTGAIHELCPVTDFITDRENKVITTPAYMTETAKPHQVFKGISGLAKELMEMA